MVFPEWPLLFLDKQMDEASFMKMGFFFTNFRFSRNCHFLKADFDPKKRWKISIKKTGRVCVVYGYGRCHNSGQSRGGFCFGENPAKNSHERWNNRC